ncbi:MAG: DUF4349 domain-containing protein [Lachnospiraceae bacterium]|nr:DUF4349 domain-containing protein [Lachnospiraceae bacterium]
MKNNKMKKCFTSVFLAIAVIGVSGMAIACGGNFKSSGGGTYAETAAASMWQNRSSDAAPAAAMPVPLGEEGAAEVAKEDALSYDMGGGDTAFAASQTQEPAGPGADANRKLIRTIHLNVETTEFDKLLAGIRQSATETGGYIEQSEISGSSISSSQPGRRYAYLAVRIPSAHLDPFLFQINEQSNVTNRSESIEDVTLQYSDIESRKKTLAVEQERLWALLEKADTLEAVIALEERLSEIRYELESFESQLRLYDNQVDYSTVYLNIDEVRVFTPTTPDSVATRIQKGFTRNLEGVVNGLVNFTVWLLSSLPTLILLAAVLALIGVIGRLLYRFIKKAIRKALTQKTGEPKPPAAAATPPAQQQPPQEKP